MNNDKCQELVNIEYQNMLLNGGKKNEGKNKEPVGTIYNIEDFLEKEKLYESKQPWGKLNKIKKFQKINEYIDSFSKKNNISDKNKSEVLSNIKNALNKKKLQRIKDVVYNKETGVIKSIPALEFDKEKLTLTLKNNEKKQSTLKSLAPKKIDGKKIKKTKTQKKGSPKHNISVKIKNSPKGKNIVIKEKPTTKHSISPKNYK